MKTLIQAFILVLFSLAAHADIYVVFYITQNGKTGHTGIAIDNYNIIVRDNESDTIKTNTLTYFDVWPERDEFTLFDFARDQKPLYYQLPNAIWSSPITIASLYDLGIPHREHYPCDAILKLRSKPKQDFLLLTFLKSELSSTRRFNPRFYNCSDFVLKALNFHTNEKIRAKEFIPFSLATTPNKLYRVLTRRSDIKAIKKAPNTVNRGFVRERILKRRAVRHASSPALALN